MYRPYIGITDFMTFEQVQAMLEVFKANGGPDLGYRLHVGVMTSYKNVRGLPNKWTNAFPINEAIAGISQSSETMNCLHYADYDEVDFYESLVMAIRFGGSGMNALQLDMVWPNADHLEQALHRSGSDLEVILQIGKNALAEAGNDPEMVVSWLEDYVNRNIVHHVLLDKSMGKGVGMDAVSLIPYARAIKEAFPDLGIAAAGGLGPTTTDLIEPLLREFPSISMDAQGKLRPSGNALDPIDWNMASEYLVKALSLKKQYA